MAIRARTDNRYEARDILVASKPLANTNDDLLTVNLSGFRQGYGFYTSGFAVDATGGWRGTYYADGTTRVDFVSIERFNITGTDYDDSIQVGDGNDVVRAGGGNDVVIAGYGSDTLDGGSGIDGLNKSFLTATTAITVNLRTNSITASQGSIANFEYFSNVVGGSRNDTFVSSTARGNDTVSGGDGADRAEFVRGYDTFSGGAGNDTLKADFSWMTGNARITTSLTAESSGEGFRGYFYANGAQQARFDTVENFEVIGTSNNDEITTGRGNDIVSGGAGNDDIRSGAGTDVLDGGAGIDGVGRDFTLLTAAITVDLAAGTVAGVTGSITNFEYFSDIYGGFGNDVFTGTRAAGADRVTGGGGDDTATFYAGYDRFFGGLGTDRLIADYSQMMTNEGIQTSFGVDTNGGYQGYYYVNGGNRTDFTSVEAVTITGTMFDDRINAGDGADVISSGAGWDVVASGGGADVLDGGDGVDGVGRTFTNATALIAVDLAAGTTRGTGGSITNFEYFAGFITGSGNDTLTSTGVYVRDDVTMGGGNDTFVSYAGYDLYAGGLGTDRLVIDWSATEQFVGINSVSLNIDTNGGFSGYYYISNAARVDFTSVEAFTVTGTRYADQMFARGGNDVLNGGAGDDVLSAGSGNDAVDGGDGIDGLGKDMTEIRANITVNLNNNSLSLAGSTIANMEYFHDVRGGSGNDTFRTTDAQLNDTVYGNGGNDKGYFLAGADLFFAGSGNGDVLYVDYSDLDTDGEISTSMSADSDNGGYRGYYYIDGGNRVDFTGVDRVDVTGTQNDDRITGTGSNDVLNGQDGRDTISGGEGSDTILGGLAADTIDGGGGGDTITGGAAADTMTGGTGADTFVFNTGDAGTSTVYVDRITDFETGIDTIDLFAIDANTGVNGNQAFAFIGNTAFTAAGQVRVVNVGGITYVQGETNGDGTADFIIRVDATVPVEADFRL